jgi:putative ABC transport system ATP-binding protein
MLEVKHLQKRFKSGDTVFNAVDNVSFKVGEGTFASIVGTSGSGKSTLLALLGALDKPTGGSVVVSGQDITKLSDSSLVGYRAKNVGFKPGRLSGGEQQRVAIARALANHPKLVLADEPTGNLDSQNGRMIFKLLHDLAKSENTTIIVVTHDLSIAGKTDAKFQLSDGKLVK